MNGIKSIANSAYVGVKNRLMTKLTEEAEKTKKDLGDAANTSTDWLNALINQKFVEVRDATIVAVAKVFTAMQQIALLIAIYSAIMLVKSFLLVFSRIFFRDGSGRYATLSPGVVRPSHGDIRAMGQRYAVTRADGRNFYVSKKYRPFGTPPATRLPFWRTAPLARIAHRALMLNLFDVKKIAGSADFRTAIPAEFVEWNLKKGESVYFSFHDFAAIERGMKIRSEINLSVSALIFGQMIFRRAIGPGTLVLRTSAASIVGKTGPAGRNMAAGGLISWHSASQFQIVASIGWFSQWDTFFSDHNIRRRRPGIRSSTTRPTTTAAG